MKKMAITISGQPGWKRYLIVTEDGRFWDGKKWTCQGECARLYADHQDVAVAFRELEERLYKNKPLRMFQATLNIRVRADQNYSVQDLQDFLVRSVSILIDQDRCGTGPVSDSLVQLDITWELRESGRKNP